jgi:hypothetical protein
VRARSREEDLSFHPALGQGRGARRRGRPLQAGVQPDAGPPPRRLRPDPDTPWRPRGSQRGWAAPLVLVALASTGAGCSLGGDGAVFVGSCTHFVATVRASEPSYAPGHTVIISVTQANDGPACTTPPQPCGPPAAVASAYNSAGEDVWDAGADKTIGLTGATCPPKPCQA